MKTQLLGGPLDGLLINFIQIPDRRTFVRNTDNIYILDNNDPKIALRTRHVYIRVGNVMQYKQKINNKQNNSV